MNEEKVDLLIRYSLTLHKPNTKVFINLSQHDLRFLLQANPSNYKNKAYSPIGIVVLKSTDPEFKKTTFTSQEKVATSLFCGVRDVSLEFVAPQGTYIIMPCTFASKIEMPFEIVIYTEHKSHIVEVKNIKPKNGLSGMWQGPYAGGCVNYPKTWMNNPQYILVCEKNGVANITLEQSTETQPLECIGLYVFKSRGQRRIPQPEQLVLTPQTFDDVPTVTEAIHVEANSNFGIEEMIKNKDIIMPTTFDPAQRGFQLSVSSDVRVSLFAPLQ